MKLPEFVDRHKESICASVVRAFPPLYDAAARANPTYNLRRLLRRPIGGQSDAVRATALSLRCQRGTVVVGEQGSGKTYIAAAASFLAGFDRVLVMAPPHLVRKWQREIRQTVPGARTAIVRSITDLDRLARVSPGSRWRHRQPGSRLGAPRVEAALYVIVSRERAKLGYRWVPCALSRPAKEEEGRLLRDEAGHLLRTLCCPACFTPLVDEEGIPLEWADLTEKRHKCPACASPLWCADRRGPRRYPLADYVRHRLPGYFDLFIADEVHELKGRGSAQGLAAATLADACNRTLALSGTIFGGYASTLFDLLRRFSPAVRTEFGYRDAARWVSRYGIVHRITKRNPDAYTEDGRQSKRRNYVTRIVEKPGIAPAVLFHLLPNSVFLRLADVDRHLPPYAERVVLYPLDHTVRGDASQATAYQQLATALLAAVRDALAKGSKRLLATYLQTLLSYPDGCIRPEIVLDKKTGDVIAAAPGLPADFLYPKERALVDLMRDQRRRGRRVVVYLANTDTRDLTPRLQAILEAEGFRVAVLKASTVAPERREEWLAKQVEAGAEVLLCHPKLVQTGLDLLSWTTYIFLQIEYSVYVMRQAARRGWRIGQTQPVEVYHFAYEGTLQAEALALIAAKLRAAVLLDGELPEEGLAALDDDGEDVFLALARRLTEDSTADAASLEALFAQAQQAAAEDDDLLADDGWLRAVSGDDQAGESLVGRSASGSSTEPIVDDRSLLIATPFATVPATNARRTPAAVGTGQLPLDLDLVAPHAVPPPRRTDGVPQAARVLTFADLARLVTRPKSRRRPASEGQLALFAA